jgi:hypothetical protein
MELTGKKANLFLVAAISLVFLLAVTYGLHESLTELDISSLTQAFESMEDDSQLLSKDDRLIVYPLFIFHLVRRFFLPGRTSPGSLIESPLLKEIPVLRC